MKREDVYAIVDGERDYQDSKWVNEPIHTPTEWLVYLQRYLTKAIITATDVPSESCNALIMEDIRKITAMGVASMEEHGCTPRLIS